MKVIVCLDDNNGMLFNNRRQSRDSLLIEHIMSGSGDEKLNILEFSKGLFTQYAGKINVVTEIKCEGVYFIENVDLTEFVDMIDEITVYKWNRAYPADFYCNIDFSGFVVKDVYEFTGNSHEKITKIVYGR